MEERQHAGRAGAATMPHPPARRLWRTLRAIGAATPPPTSSAAADVPVLDIAEACALLAVAPASAADWAAAGERLRPLARVVDAACRSSGFFCITGHGADARGAMAGLESASSEFFGLPAEVKLVARSPSGAAYGYQPLEAEALAMSEDGELEVPPDAKETISFGPLVPFPVARLRRRPPGLEEVAEFALGPDFLPPEPYGRRLLRSVTAYSTELHRTGLVVLRLLALALELPDSESFARGCNKPGHMSALRLNNYPPSRGAPQAGQMRAGAHSDYGAITLLHQGSGSDAASGGLQIETGGEWRSVPVVPGGLVVNIGDMLQLWSSERYRSTRHRVTVPAAGSDSATTGRLSVAYFLQPAFDAVISPLGAGGAQSDEEPITAGAHVWAKFKQAQGEEEKH